jgi:hypothetical protein
VKTCEHQIAINSRFEDSLPHGDGEVPVLVDKIVSENEDERPDSDLVAKEFDVGLGLTWSR